MYFYNRVSPRRADPQLWPLGERTKPSCFVLPRARTTACAISNGKDAVSVLSVGSTYGNVVPGLIRFRQQLGRLELRASERVLCHLTRSAPRPFPSALSFHAPRTKGPPRNVLTNCKAAPAGSNTDFPFVGRAGGVRSHPDGGDSLPSPSAQPTPTVRAWAFHAHVGGGVEVSG